MVVQVYKYIAVASIVWLYVEEDYYNYSLEFLSLLTSQ